MTIGPAPMIRMLLMSVRLGMDEKRQSQRAQRTPGFAENLHVFLRVLSVHRVERFAVATCPRSGRTGNRHHVVPDLLRDGPGSRTPGGRCAQNPAACRRTAKGGGRARAPARAR